MTKLGLKLLALLFLFHFSYIAQTFFQRNINNDELEDFGHYSIEQLGYIGDDYVLAGTQYDGQGGSFIEFMHIMDSSGNRLPVGTGAWSIKTTNENFKDLKCFRLNKKGKDGNFLAIGSATRITDNKKVGLLIEMLDPTMEPIKYTVIDGAPLEQDGYMNTLAFDAEYIAQNANEGITQGGYLVCGMLFQPASANYHQVFKDTPKRSFYAMLDDNMNSTHYFFTFNNDTPDTTDSDYLHRVKYIEGIGAVLGGSKMVGNRSTAHLLLIDPANGTPIWQMNKAIGSSISQEFSSVADFLYDAQNDALHVAYNKFDPYHSGGFFSVFNFSFANKSLSTAASFVSQSIVSQHLTNADNQYFKMLLPHPDNLDSNMQTPFRFIAQMDFEIKLNTCTAIGMQSKQNVYTAYAEFDYNSNTLRVDPNDFMFKKAATAHWNEAYSPVLNSTINNLPNWGYSNSFCLATDASASNSKAVFIHYTTINNRIDLNIFKRYTAAIASDLCYERRAFDRYPEIWVNTATYNPYTYPIELEDVLLYIPNSTQFNVAESSPCSDFGSNCYSPFLGAPYHSLRKKFIAQNEGIEEPLLVAFAFEKALVVNGINEFASLQLFDLSGKLVFEKQALRNGTLLLDFLESGAYVFRIQEGNKMTSAKFILQH